MKKAILLAIIIIFGTAYTCPAGLTEEETSHDFVKDAKVLLVMQDDEYYPDYTQEKLETAAYQENDESNALSAIMQGSSPEIIPADALDTPEKGGNSKPEKIPK